jgi:hypothetical protein
VANSDITNGANYLAALNLDGNAAVRLRKAAISMGISDEDAAKLIFRAKRKLERGGRSNTPIDQVVDQFVSKAGKVSNLNVEMPADIDMNRTISNSEVEYGEFGNQDEIQNFGGLDKQGRTANREQAQQEIEKARGKRDSNLLSRTYFEKGKEGPQREELYIPDGMPVPARFVEAAKDRDFGIYQEGVAAPAAQVQRMERDALIQGVDQYGADAFPGVQDPQRAEGVLTPSAADLIGRINDDIQGNRSAEQSLVREIVLRDRQRQNSEVVESNNWRAQAAANLIGQDFAVGGRGAAADQAIANIGNIAQLGPAKVAYDFQVSNNPVDRGTAIPDSLPLNLPDQYNAPLTDNRYAGPLQKQEQWLVDAIPGYRQSGAFGAYGDVSINEQISLARAAIQNAKIKGQVVDLGDMQIRGLMDLQEAADQVISLGRQNNQPFFNQVDGRNIVNRNPGIGEVLERGGMNARQVGDVAKAMFALEAARRNPINKARKEMYFGGESVNLDRPVEFGGYHPALGGGEARISMLGREKVGGREIKGQLQKLDGKRGNPGEPLNAQELAEARMPFQGGVAGEGVKRARFVRGADRGLSEDAIYEKYGPINGQIANEVIQRAEQAQGSNPDGFGVRVERQRNMDPGPVFDVGPDPWTQPVGTSTGFTQQIVRTTSQRPQAALPYGIQSAGPSQGPTRPLTNELKNELAALSSGYSEQGPRPAANFTDPGIKPDGPSVSPRRIRQEADYRQSVRNLGRIRGYGRNAAIAGGAVAGLAGLDGLINGERRKREEEQYR